MQLIDPRVTVPVHMLEDQPSDVALVPVPSSRPVILTDDLIARCLKDEELTDDS